MARRLLALLTIPAFAALATAAPPIAHAQDIFGTQSAAVNSVMNGLRRLCRARGMRAFFVADFLFGVDADRDGRGDDIYLTAAGFSCVRRGADPGESTDQGHNLCNDRGCMQWLIVKGRGPARLVWRGRTPTLFAAGQEGLVDTTTDCGENCPRYVWNGRALVRWRGRR